MGFNPGPWAPGPGAYLAGRQVEVHSNGVGGVHEDVRHAHQVLDGLKLQTQQVPVKGLPSDGLVWVGDLSEAGTAGSRHPHPPQEPVAVLTLPNPGLLEP